MPHLIEWQVHHPSDWTAAQAGEYTKHVYTQLIQHLVPVNQALGASKVAGILLACVAVLARSQPLAARDICTQMGNAFEVVEALDPLGVDVVKQ